MTDLIFTLTPSIADSLISLCALGNHPWYENTERPIRDFYVIMSDPNVFLELMNDEKFISVEKYQDTCPNLFEGEIGQYSNATLVGVKGMRTLVADSAKGRAILIHILGQEEE